MPQAKRRAIGFLMVMVSAIFLLFVALILLMTRPAWPAEPIPCWQAKALLAFAGSEVEAEKLARKRGYSQSQIAEVRRRCSI